MTITEQEEADNLLGNIVAGENKDNENDDDSENAGNDNDNNGENGADAQNPDSDSGKPTYVVDPNTGELVNPDTGEPAEMNYNYEGDGSNAVPNEGEAQPPAPDGAQ